MRTMLAWVFIFWPLIGRSHALSVFKVAGSTERVAILASYDSINNLQRWTRSDFNNFCKEIDSVILKAESILRVKIPDSMQLIFATQKELENLSGSPKVLGWVNKGDSNKVYLSDALGFSRISSHYFAHELFHTQQNQSHPVWVQEGLAELFAWQMTGHSPALAILAFKGSGTPISLTQSKSGILEIENYGMSFLYFKYLSQDKDMGPFFEAWRHKNDQFVNTEKFRNFVRSLAIDFFVEGTTSNKLLPPFSMLSMERKSLNEEKLNPLLEKIENSADKIIIFNPSERNLLF